MRGIIRSSSVQMVSVISGLLCRNLSTSHCRLAVDKALLSKLRKQTGIPFINCKKALEKFDNDFDEAKQWLQDQAQKEGWARATKLQSRPMSQGLVALLGDHTQATLLEVNCETDFVARNEKFVDMVSKLVQECNRNLISAGEKRVDLKKEELGEMKTTDSSKLADVVALNVGNLGENMSMRRAAYLSASGDSFLYSYVHPSNPNQKNDNLKVGKYGAVVELCRVDASSLSSSPDTSPDLLELGSHVCQHIVGMNPKGIGEFLPDATGRSKTRHQSVESGEDDSNVVSGEGQKEEETSAVEQEQEANDLLSQEFLLDTSVTVGELLHSNGVEVKDFVRFACGEEGEEEVEG